MATAVFGGGCFWCTEAVFSDLRGVQAVKSGYAGGHAKNPTYEQVCGGRTGHAEVVRVTYDPAEITYGDLLRVFFATHDPTTPNRQGADTGTQYRSIVLTQSDEERDTARAVIAEMQPLWEAPIVTEIVPLTEFWPAEAKHDDYFARNPWTGYCQVVVAPKVAKLRQKYADKLKAA